MSARKQDKSISQSGTHLTSRRGSSSHAIVTGSEGIRFFFENREEIESLLVCEFLSPSKIKVTARPDSFGIVRWDTENFYVYPKFLCTGNLPDFDLMTGLFFIVDGSQPRINDAAVVDQVRENFSNFFDFYFYNLLTQIRKFIKLYSKVEFATEIQEINGIKGKIRFEETLRQFGGLSHKSVCEVGSTERNLLLFGMIKSLSKTVLSLSSQQLVKDLGRIILSELKDFKEFQVNKENLNKLSFVSAKITRESHKTKSLFRSIIRSLSFLTNNAKTFSSATFSFDMDLQYECLVKEFLVKYSPEGLDIKSGNECAQRLLNCQSGIIEIEDDTNKTGLSSRVVNIKPDLIVSKNGNVLFVGDTKYKTLKIKKKNDVKQILGVKSSDIQQILTYWLHFTEKCIAAPEAKLIYPLPEGFGSDECLVETLGVVEFGLIGLQSKKAEKVFIEIVGISVQKLIKLMSKQEFTEEELRLAARALVSQKSFGPVTQKAGSKD